MAMINLANVASSCCHSIGTATATKDARSKGITLPNDNSNPNVGSHPSKFSLILAMLVVLGLFFGWIMLADSISSSTNTTKLISPLSYEKTGFITQDSKTRYLTAIDQMGETFRVTKTESGVWQITKSQSVTGTRSLKLDPATK